MTTIAIFMPYLVGGGIEKMCMQLARYFLGRGLDVTFVVTAATKADLSLVPEKAGVVILNTKRTLGAIFPLVQYLRREKPDVILCGHGHNSIVLLWARALSGAPTKVIISQHNALSSERRFNGSWQHFVLPVLYRLFLRMADKVFAVSQGVANDLAKACNYPLDKIKVIYNSVLSDDFGSDMTIPSEVQSLWDGGAPVIVSMGRLVEQKDFGTLIRAFHVVRQKCAARLVIIGSGADKQSLEQLAEELGVLGEVTFLGYTQKPERLLARSSVFVLSSRYEGFGNVIVEAMAVGLPIVSTNCPYGPSEILEDGRYGQLVPVGDFEAMARAIEAALEKPEEGRAERIARAHIFETKYAAESLIDLMQAAQPTADWQNGQGTAR